MSQYLPTGKFKWIKQNQIEQLNLAKYKESSKTGLILEVDLEYSKKLHDLHNDYPLAAEKIEVTEDMLSKCAKEIKHNFNISKGQVHQLIPTLHILIYNTVKRTQAKNSFEEDFYKIDE